MIGNNIYTPIYLWMIDELGLTLTEAVAFSVIYCINSNNGVCYNNAHIARWIGKDRSTASRVVNSLEKKGLIEIIKEPSKPNIYKVADAIIEKYTATDRAPHQEETPTDKQPNKTTTNTQKRFVKPSIAEVAEYCAQRHNGIDAEAFVAHYESKGWRIGSSPMKDWKSAVITWEKRNKTNTAPAQPNKNTPDAIKRQAMAMRAKTEAYKAYLQKQK